MEEEFQTKYFFLGDIWESYGRAGRQGGQVVRQYITADDMWGWEGRGADGIC